MHCDARTHLLRGRSEYAVLYQVQLVRRENRQTAIHERTKANDQRIPIQYANSTHDERAPQSIESADQICSAPRSAHRGPDTGSRFLTRFTSGIKHGRKAKQHDAESNRLARRKRNSANENFRSRVGLSSSYRTFCVRFRRISSSRVGWKNRSHLIHPIARHNRTYAYTRR